MKVYVNGCSFSYGHNELLERKGKVWPQHLHNHDDKDLNKPGWTRGYHVENESLSGGSSHRSLRMCMDRAMRHGQKNQEVDIIICQLSNPHRGEFFHQDLGMYINYISNRFILGEKEIEVFKQQGFTTRKDTQFFNEKGESIEDVYFHKNVLWHNTVIVPEWQRQIEILALCNNLEKLCKIKGIKLLFTAMSSICVPSYHGDMTLMPYITKPMSHIVGRSGSLVESETDNHPNEAGHEKIYRYIISELEKL